MQEETMPDEHDELYEEVKQYRDLFENCTAEEILALLGEMSDFFFGRMTAEDFEIYERVRSDLNIKT